MAEILLPPVCEQDEEKVIQMINSIGEYLNVKVECEKVVSIRVTFPENKPELASILQRLSGNKTGLRQAKNGRSSKKTKYGEPRFVPDPLGS